MVPRIALGSQRARPCIESSGVSGAWASSRARTMATRGPVSTTARSLTSKAFHLVRVGGEVRRGLGSSTLEAAVQASLTQDIKSRHLALIRPAPWPRRGLPALVDLMIDKGRCLPPKAQPSTGLINLPLVRRGFHFFMQSPALAGVSATSGYIEMICEEQF